MEIQKLCHKKFGKMRFIFLNGKIYLLGKDAAISLGFKKTEDAIRRHVEEQDKFTLANLAEQAGELLPRFTGSRIAHNAIWINESGLYSLVMHSKLPFAKELQHWVTSEVLPSIRENGYYINPHAAAPAPAPVPEVSEVEISRLDKIKILRELLDYTDCKNLRNKLICDIAYIVTRKIY